MENNQGRENTSANATDLTYLYDLADGSFDFVEEMINMFLNSVPKAAVELEAAISKGEWANVKAIAHRIKPSFGFIGAKKAQEYLNQMERNAIEAPDSVLLTKLYQQVSSILKQCLIELETELADKK